MIGGTFFRGWVFYRFSLLLLLNVFILYDLRQTGKTTLIRQAILDMTPEQLNTAAFIQIKTKDTLAGINADLKYLEDQGYRYVFIDEVTLMEDFIEGTALFSDIYASSDMKSVLSGADSLGFIFTEYKQLYDHCILLHLCLTIWQFLHVIFSTTVQTLWISPKTSMKLL